MLILSRKKGEAILIGEDIQIIITDIQGDHVKIGVAAPKDVKIFRSEIYEEIKAENRQAIVSNSTDLNEIISIIKKQK